VKTKQLLIFLIALWGSNLFAQYRKEVPLNPEKTIEIVYDFAETSDSNFCNANSIITMDCAGGSLYFTNAGNIYLKKNGNVICTFLNEDSTIYNIGKYTITTDGIDCVFDQIYSFENNYYSNEKTNPVGVLKKIAPWNMELSKLACKKFDYNFISSEKSKYVLYKCNRSNSEIFIRILKKINRY
jgi:hypothetical protein